MAGLARVQPRMGWVDAVALAGMLVTASLLIAAYLEPLTGPVGADPTAPEIRHSAELPVVFWCVGWPIALVRRTLRPAVPLFWTIGCVTAWVHVALAFHLGHGWSHAAAWQHTRQVGGYGDGIFVNYAFVLVWLADVVWVWVAPSSYVGRPAWLNGAVHGFLAFVVFNAAVVFGSAAARELFATSFGLSLVGLLVLERVRRVRRRRRTRSRTRLE